MTAETLSKRTKKDLSSPLSSAERWGPALLLLIVLGLAFALRVYRLDAQSFWSDEGASMTMAGRNLAEIARAAAADIHPPLYYVFLHWWSLAVGNGEFALRYLSVAFGLLSVAIIFKTGQRLCGTAVGLAAAFIAALAPFLIYYAQEARMYAQMVFLTALSVYLFLVILDRLQAAPERLDYRGRTALLWTAYVVVTAAALYTQYYAFTVVIVENLWFLVRQSGKWRSGLWVQVRTWAIWLAAQVLVVLLYLPWLSQSAKQLAGWPSISESFGLPTLLRRVFLVFSFGISWDMTATAKTELLFGLLVIASLLSLSRRLRWPSAGRSTARGSDGGNSDGVGASPGKWSEDRPRRLALGANAGEKGPGKAKVLRRNYAANLAFIALYLAVPVLIMYLLSLQRPMYNPKLLLLATPPFYLLLGIGVAALARLGRVLPASLPWSAVWRTTAVGVIFVGLLGSMTYATNRSLAAYYFDPKYARDDYRGLAKMIAVSQREGDAIILNAPGQQEIFGYYYHGTVPVYPLPKQRPIDEAATGQELRQIAAGHQRVWLVLWAVEESDPHQFIENWFNQNAFKTDTRWFGNVRLVLYTTAADGGAQIDHPVQATFDHQIRLLGYNLTEAAGGEETRAGEVLRLTLFWQPTQKLDQRYTVFTHLIDDHEYIWGQRDSEPGGGARLTTTWAVGEVISDNYGIPVYLGTPPGEYSVEIGLYRAADGSRLAVQDSDGKELGDRLILGPVRLGRPDRPPEIAALSVEHSLDAGLGPLRLVGYDLYKLGFDRGNVDFRPGDIAHLTLYWQAKEKPGPGYQILVQVVDKSGQVVLSREVDPADGRYPSVQWERGEIVRDQHKIPLDLVPGQYRLLVGLKRDGQLVGSGKGSDGLLTLATLGVQPR